jgi:hypothetical protein
MLMLTTATASLCTTAGAHTDAEIIDRPNNVTRTAIMLKRYVSLYYS